MTFSRGFSSTAGAFPRTAARVVAAALVAAAMFAVLWAGPVADASSFHAQSRASASSSPARVKYYIVPPARHGRPAESLYVIAAKTLGSGNLFMEIFNLNKGRLQPDGGRLKSPQAIDASWVLQLPADASGPGVHFGRLPGATASATTPASHPAPRPAASSTAVHSSLFHTAILVGGILIVFAIAVLTVALSRRRRAGAAARRRVGHDRSPRPRASGSTGISAPAGPSARGNHPSWPDADYRSVPGGDYPSRPGGDYPSRPGGDYPSRPGGDYRSVPGADRPSVPGAFHPNVPLADHPSFPGGSYPSWPEADHPSFPGGGYQNWAGVFGGPAPPRPEPPPGSRHEPHWQPVSPPALAPQVQVPAGSWGPQDLPGGGAPGGAQQWSAQLARTAGLTAQAHYEVAYGDSQFQVVLSDAAVIGRAQATSVGSHARDILPVATEQAGLVEPARPHVRDLWNADSVRLAGRILSEADNQAAETSRRAADQAAATLAAAELDAADMKRQAADIKRRAADQAAATLAAAELDAAELRTTVMMMSAELGSVAAYVTESLGSHAKPATTPTSRPRQHVADDLISPAKPAPEPATKPAGTKTRAQPAARPARRPAARPATKPKGRQVSAMHKMVAALVVLFLVGAATGTAEIALHGFKFFVFRDAGAGAGNSRNLDEDQGPGQPDAPGVHHKSGVTKPTSKPTPSSRPDSKPGKSN